MPSISAEFELLAVLSATQLSREEAARLAVDRANEAIAGLSDACSEDVRESYGGCAWLDADGLRMRFGPLPRAFPDAGDLADELDPIPLRDVIVDS